MSDPFADVSATGPDMIGMIVSALESRAADPHMTPIVDAYVARLDPPPGSLVLDIGAGTGGITRRIAARMPECAVMGLDPSPELIAEAQRLEQGIDTLEFRTGNAYALDIEDEAASVAIFHTVLSHVDDPSKAMVEAYRVLKPGGQLVVCDADFSKLAVGLDDSDPLQACAHCFSRHFVTDAWLAGKLRGLAVAAGFSVEDFRVDNRLDLTGEGGGATWIRFAAGWLVREGVIGQPLAEALSAEWTRRSDAGIAYGVNPFVTLIARRA